MIVTHAVTAHRLRAGDVGTVVERHVVPGAADDGYAVEFFDMTDSTVAVVTLSASAFACPQQPTVRPCVCSTRRPTPAAATAMSSCNAGLWVEENLDL